MDWYNDYRSGVLSCEACTARQECSNPVPGEGDLTSKFVVIGRNPGKTEDAIGRPFVGPAGEILDEFLKLCGLSRSKGCFVTNMCLCHTNQDRFMSKAEVKACVKLFLLPTLMNLKPKIVMVLGNQPNYFINGVKSVTHNHGKFFQHSLGFVSLCSLHPAVVCYNPDLWVRFTTLAPVVRRVLEYS